MITKEDISYHQLLMAAYIYAKGVEKNPIRFTLHTDSEGEEWLPLYGSHSRSSSSFCNDELDYRIHGTFVNKLKREGILEVKNLTDSNKWYKTEMPCVRVSYVEEEINKHYSHLLDVEAKDIPFPHSQSTGWASEPLDLVNPSTSYTLLGYLFKNVNKVEFCAMRASNYTKAVSHYSVIYRLPGEIQKGEAYTALSSLCDDIYSYSVVLGKGHLRDFLLKDESLRGSSIEFDIRTLVKRSSLTDIKNDVLKEIVEKEAAIDKLKLEIGARKSLLRDIRAYRPSKQHEKNLIMAPILPSNKKTDIFKKRILGGYHGKA